MACACANPFPGAGRMRRQKSWSSPTRKGALRVKKTLKERRRGEAQTWKKTKNGDRPPVAVYLRGSWAPDFVAQSVNKNNRWPTDGR